MCKLQTFWAEFGKTSGTQLKRFQTRAEPLHREVENSRENWKCRKSAKSLPVRWKWNPIRQLNNRPKLQVLQFPKQNFGILNLNSAAFLKWQVWATTPDHQTRILRRAAREKRTSGFRGWIKRSWNFHPREKGGVRTPSLPTRVEVPRTYYSATETTAHRYAFRIQNSRLVVWCGKSATSTVSGCLDKLWKSCPVPGVGNISSGNTSLPRGKEVEVFLPHTAFFWYSKVFLPLTARFSKGQKYFYRLPQGLLR